jgi:hypothetical protein
MSISMFTSHSVVGGEKSFLEAIGIYSYDHLFVATQWGFITKSFHWVVFHILVKSSISS